MKYAAWLSDQTKSVLKERNLAQATETLTKDPDDWRKYKNLRNTATMKMRAEKKTWERQKLDNNQNSPSSLWKNVTGVTLGLLVDCFMREL